MGTTSLFTVRVSVMYRSLFVTGVGEIVRVLVSVTKCWLLWTGVGEIVRRGFPYNPSSLYETLRFDVDSIVRVSNDEGLWWRSERLTDDISGDSKTSSRETGFLLV